MQQRLSSLLLFVGMLELFGCTSSCDSSSTQTTRVKRKPTSTQITTFPGIATTSLQKDQLEIFTNLANEEICPCRCPTSFAGCLQGDGKCKSAEILGQWIVDTMADGFPPATLAPIVTLEIGSGYGAPRAKTIDISAFVSKGAKKPKVTIVEFADFDCSHCKTAAPILEAFVKKHEDSVSFVFKYFPRGTAAGGLAAAATEAAARQGKFWEMHDALFKIDLLTEAKIVEAARNLGLKMDRFNQDRKEADVILKVQHSTQEALSLGAKGTPAIFFVGQNGDARPYFLTPDMSGFEARLAMELARDEVRCAK